MISQNTKCKWSIYPQCWDYLEQYQTLLVLVTNVYCSSCIAKLRGINPKSANPSTEFYQSSLPTNNMRNTLTKLNSVKKYKVLEINNPDENH